jgi:hypothetical protein
LLLREPGFSGKQFVTMPLKTEIMRELVLKNDNKLFKRKHLRFSSSISIKEQLIITVEGFKDIYNSVDIEILRIKIIEDSKQFFEKISWKVPDFENSSFLSI